MDYDAWKSGWNEEEFGSVDFAKASNLPDQEEVELCIESAARSLITELDTKKAAKWLKALCALYDVDLPEARSDSIKRVIFEDEFRNVEYLKQYTLPDQDDVECCIEAAARYLLVELDSKKSANFIKTLCVLYDIEVPGGDNE